jgi:hypothetical protein
MGARDYAVVVGISRYPGFGAAPTEPAHLDAPARDATDVYKWMVSEDGGAVPPDHVILIRSDDPPPAVEPVLTAKPQLQAIQTAFQQIVLKGQENEAAGKGFKIGRRLYIYMAGHGFAPGTYTSCLYLANATRVNAQNAYASGWLQWFQDAACFEEFVLWMDCCMDRMVTVVPEAIPLVPRPVDRPAAPTMIAFGATRSLHAVETEIEGRVRGVFTHALLTGLKGAAADRTTARITARSLSDYLFNSMKDWIPATELEKPIVAKEPAIVQADERILFTEATVPGTTARDYRVTLRFPDIPAGTPVRLWRGEPLASEDLAIMDGTSEKMLPRGLYMVEVTEPSLRKGFEVTGSGPVDVTVATADRCPARREPPANGKCRLNLAATGASEIFVVDAGFRLAARDNGAELPYGIYKVKTRLGRDVDEKIIFLDSDDPVVLGKPAESGLAALLSVNSLMFPGVDRSAAAQVDVPVHVRAGEGAEVFLMIDNERSVGAGTATEGVKLLDSRRRVIADLDVHGEERVGSDELPGGVADRTFACCRVSVRPGAYFLRRHAGSGMVVEQTIPAIHGFRTEMHQLRTQPHAGAGNRLVQQLLTMTAIDDPVLAPHPAQRAVLMDAATVALADHRRALTDELRTMLIDDFKDPVAGILGAHLLLIEAESSGQPAGAALPALDDLVPRLRTMAGEVQPDIEALSQRCTQPGLRGKQALQYPPLFSRSWKLAVEASAADSGLLPGSMWERVRATVSIPPYFGWAADAHSRAAHERDLLVQVRAVLDLAPGPPMDAAVPMTTAGSGHQRQQAPAAAGQESGSTWGPGSTSGAGSASDTGIGSASGSGTGLAGAATAARVRPPKKATVPQPAEASGSAMARQGAPGAETARAGSRASAGPPRDATTGGRAWKENAVKALAKQWSVPAAELSRLIARNDGSDAPGTSRKR